MKSQLNEGRIDLNGKSYAEQIAAGTNNVVTAGANTKGIKIAVAGVLSNSAANEARVEIGGNKLLWARGASGNDSQIISNVFVPPAVALDLITTHAECKAWVWYEVIA